jgi:hypothetical protein
MRVVRKDDISKSVKLAERLEWLMAEGRKERDQKIFNIETELLEFKRPWDEAVWMSRNADLQKLNELINEKKTLKGIVSSQWAAEVNKVENENSKLTFPYASEMVGELHLTLKRTQRFFDFTYEKIWAGARDIYQYKFRTNVSQIDEVTARLLEAKGKIIAGQPTLSLKTLLQIFDTAIESLSGDYPLDEEVTGDVETLASFRARREMASEPLLFEQDRRFVSFNQPGVLGEFWGKKQPLIDHFKK